MTVLNSLMSSPRCALSVLLDSKMHAKVQTGLEISVQLTRDLENFNLVYSLNCQFKGKPLTLEIVFKFNTIVSM